DSRMRLSYLSSFRRDKFRHLKGVTLCLAKPGADNYYHFLCESLPMLLLMKEKFPDIYFDYVVLSGGYSQFKINWLAHADVDRDRILFTEYETKYICDQLIFLSDISYQYAPNPLTVRLLADFGRRVWTAPTGNDQPEFIIASRGDASTRAL